VNSRRFQQVWQKGLVVLAWPLKQCEDLSSHLALHWLSAAEIQLINLPGGRPQLPRKHDVL
jgi:hypothetical protein